MTEVDAVGTAVEHAEMLASEVGRVQALALTWLVESIAAAKMAEVLISRAAEGTMVRAAVVLGRAVVLEKLAIVAVATVMAVAEGVGEKRGLAVKVTLTVSALKGTLIWLMADTARAVVEEVAGAMGMQVVEKWKIAVAMYPGLGVRVLAG